MKIAIIKADDMRFSGNFKNWDKFIKIASDRNIKVSIGIIGYSDPLKDKTEYYRYLRNAMSTGYVEYWNHGWEHVPYKNFDAAVQKEKIEKCQALSKEIFGVPFTTFGFPGNGYNTQSTIALNSIPEIKAVFIRPIDGCNFLESFDKILIKSGPKVSVKEARYIADSSIFINHYMRRINKSAANQVMSIEFHPAGHNIKGFQETEKIFDFLLNNGWTFMLPTEYINYLASVEATG